jgi:nucleotide-binding universal stress UspA family protein
VDTAVQFGYSGVFEMPVIYLPDAVEEIVKRVRGQLEEHILHNFPGLKVSPLVLEASGPIYHSLTALIDQERFDLVIMATHGRSGLRRALMGSVTEQVLRHSTSPVLVVPVAPLRSPGA